MAVAVDPTRFEDASVPELLARVRADWKLLAVGVLAGLGVGIGVVVAAPPVHAATAGLAVVIPPGTISAGAGTVDSIMETRRATYAELATSDLVLEPVIDRLRLDVDASDLASRVHVESTGGSGTIAITAFDADPRTAAETADALAAELATVAAEIESPSATVGVPTSQLVQMFEAIEPSGAAWPQRTLGLAFGLVLGLFIGLALVVGRMIVDPRLGRATELERFDVAGVVGRIPSDSIATRSAPLPAAGGFGSAPWQALADAVRPEDGAPGSIAICADRRDVVAHVAVNLAVAAAAHGRRVVVIDADPDGFPADLLLNAEQGDASTPRRTRFAGVEVIATGIPGRGPGTGSRVDLGRVLDDLARDGIDAVIIAPPLLESATGVELAALADDTLLVATVGRTNGRRFRAALALLRGAPVSFRGILAYGTAEGRARARRRPVKVG